MGLGDDVFCKFRTALGELGWCSALSSAWFTSPRGSRPQINTNVDITKLEICEIGPRPSIFPIKQILGYPCPS